MSRYWVAGLIILIVCLQLAGVIDIWDFIPQQGGTGSGDGDADDSDDPPDPDPPDPDPPDPSGPDFGDDDGDGGGCSDGYSMCQGTCISEADGCPDY